MKKLKFLYPTVWYAAPGGAKAFEVGDTVEIPDTLQNRPLISSWILNGVVEEVAG